MLYELHLLKDGLIHPTFVKLNNKFSKAKIEFDIHAKGLELVNDKYTEKTTICDYGFNINNVGFENITLPLGGDTVDVDLALFEDFDSGLELENPQFTITVDNPFSLSGSINGDLLAHSQYGAQEVLVIDVDVEPNTISFFDENRS